MSASKSNKKIKEIESESLHTYFTKQEAINHIKNLEQILLGFSNNFKELIQSSEYENIEDKVKDLEAVDIHIEKLEKLININYIIL